MNLRSGRAVPKPVSKPAPKVRATKMTIARATAVAQRRESLEAPQSPLETRQPAQRVGGQVSVTRLHVSCTGMRINLSDASCCALEGIWDAGISLSVCRQPSPALHQLLLMCKDRGHKLHACRVADRSLHC